MSEAEVKASAHVLPDHQRNTLVLAMQAHIQRHGPLTEAQGQLFRDALAGKPLTLEQIVAVFNPGSSHE